MEFGLIVVLVITLIVGILLVKFNSVSTEAVKYRKNIEHINFDEDTPLTEEEFMRRLSLLQLDMYRQDLYPLIKHEIAMKISVCEDNDISLCSSKIGGFPHLPDNEFDFANLIFLAQINCSQIKEFDKDNLFPEKGMLYFFLDPEKINIDVKNSVIVHYVSSLNNLSVQKNINTSLEIKSGVIQFSQNISLPEYDSDIIQNLLKDYEIDGYFKLTNKEHNHKLSGYPNTITQHFIANEDKILLLQLDSDEICHLSWGNMGKLYVFIDKDKLHKQQFDKLYTYIQSYQSVDN